MSEQELSLEELIFQVDQDSNDEFSQPTDPAYGSDVDPFDDGITGDDPTPDDDDSTPDSEPQSDPQPEPEPDPTPDPEPTPTPEPEGDDPEPQTGSDIYSEYYDILKSNDMLYVPEDFEFDGTAEGLEKAIQATKSNLSKAAAQSLIESFPEEFQPVLNYVVNGGQNVSEFLQKTSSAEIDQFNLDNVAEQKAVLREYFKTTTDYDDDKISKLIDRSELADSLREDAIEAVDELKAHKAKIAEQLAQQAAVQKEEARRLEEESRRQVFSVIDEAPYIKTNRKGKVKAFMFNKVTRDNVESTDFQRTISQISTNPEHLVQLADILLHYDPKKGIDLERFKEQNRSEATSSLKERLEQVTDTKSKVRGDGSKITQSSFN